MSLSPPGLLADHYQLHDFACGEASLDNWLQRRARPNQVSGASRTYVVCDDGRVVGYYALASGAVAQTAAPGRVRRNMPDPIPVVVLARLAVDRSQQGRGLGRAMVRDAASRIAQAAERIGIRAILVHAISEEAQRFYIALGFDPCVGDPMILVITLQDLQSSMCR